MALTPKIRTLLALSRWKPRDDVEYSYREDATGGISIHMTMAHAWTEVKLKRRVPQEVLHKALDRLQTLLVEAHTERQLEKKLEPAHNHLKARLQEISTRLDGIAQGKKGNGVNAS